MKLVLTQVFTRRQPDQDIANRGFINDAFTAVGNAVQSMSDAIERAGTQLCGQIKEWVQNH